MNISRKTLKERAKYTLSNNSILIVILLMYSFTSVIFTFFGVFFNFIPIIGFILYLGIIFGICAFSFQVSKAHVDASNEQRIDLLDFSKLKKAIFTSLWTILYCLPGIILSFIGYFILCITLLKELLIQLQKYNYFTFFETSQNSNPVLFLVGFLLIIIASIYLIIIEYSYMLSIYMVYDNDKYDSLTARETLKECKRIMKGNKFKLFVLQLSFIGWAFLIGFVSLIPFIGWLISPVLSTILSCYMMLTQIEFYKEISAESITPVQTLNMYK